MSSSAASISLVCELVCLAILVWFNNSPTTVIEAGKEGKQRFIQIRDERWMAAVMMWLMGLFWFLFALGSGAGVDEANSTNRTLIATLVFIVFDAFVGIFVGILAWREWNKQTKTPSPPGHV